MHALELLVRLGPDDGMPWRRLALAAEASLGDLHDAIQASCGWRNKHLHAFIRPEVPFRCSGWTIAELASERGCPDPADVPMSAALRAPGDRLTYCYDYGDDWIHDVLVEGIAPGAGGRLLLDGHGAFPPEDCGGIPGYEVSAEIARRVAEGGTPRDEYEAERLEWLGGWHPDDFDRVRTQREVDLDALPRRAPAVSMPSLDVILGGRWLAPEVRERCESTYAQLRDTHEPDQVVRAVRGLASKAAYEEELLSVESHLPGQPREVAAFYEILRGAHGRLRELAADDAPRAAAYALDLAEFLIERQDDIPYDDDLNFHVEPLVVDAARWACDGRPQVRPLRPLVERIATLVEADGHGTLNGLARELRKLRWAKPQRERLRALLDEAVRAARAGSPVAQLAADWIV